MDRGKNRLFLFISTDPAFPFMEDKLVISYSCSGELLGRAGFEPA